MSDITRDHTRRRIGLSLLSAGVGEILNKISPLIVLIFAKRRLGVEGFGEAQNALTTMETLIPFIAFGYASIASIEIGQNLSDRRFISQSMGDVLSLKFLHFLLVIAIAYVSASLFHAGFSYPVFFASALLLVASSLDTDFIHFGTQTMVARNIVTMIAKLISLVGFIFLVNSPKDIAIYTLFAAIPAFAVSIMSMWYNLKRYPMGRPNWGRMWLYFKGSISFGLLGYVFTYLDRFDVLMSNNLLGDVATGFYAGQMRFVQSISTAASSIGLIFYSEMVADQSKEGFSNLAAKSLWGMLALVAPIACGVWFVGSDILVMTYGEDFRPHAMVLNILATSSLFLVFIQVFGNQILVIKRRVWSYILWMALSIGIGMGASFALVSSLGLSGIAWGNLIAKAVSSVGFIWIARVYLVNFPWRDTLGVAVPCALMVLVLFVIPTHSIWVNIPVGGAVYVGSLLAWNHKKIRSILGKGRAA